jgi:hypothetical protein
MISNLANIFALPEQAQYAHTDTEAPKAVWESDFIIAAQRHILREICKGFSFLLSSNIIGWPENKFIVHIFESASTRSTMIFCKKSPDNKSCIVGEDENDGYYLDEDRVFDGDAIYVYTRAVDFNDKTISYSINGGGEIKGSTEEMIYFIATDIAKCFRGLNRDIKIEDIMQVNDHLEWEDAKKNGVIHDIFLNTDYEEYIDNKSKTQIRCFENYLNLSRNRLEKLLGTKLNLSKNKTDDDMCHDEALWDEKIISIYNNAKHIIACCASDRRSQKKIKNIIGDWFKLFCQIVCGNSVKLTTAHPYQEINNYLKLAFTYNDNDSAMGSYGKKISRFEFNPSMNHTPKSALLALMQIVSIGYGASLDIQYSKPGYRVKITKDGINKAIFDIHYLSNKLEDLCLRDVFNSIDVEIIGNEPLYLVLKETAASQIFLDKLSELNISHSEQFDKECDSHTKIMQWDDIINTISKANNVCKGGIHASVLPMKGRRNHQEYDYPDNHLDPKILVKMITDRVKDINDRKIAREESKNKRIMLVGLSRPERVDFKKNINNKNF